MSETAPINDVSESNGAMEQHAYNGDVEEHASKYNWFNILLFWYKKIYAILHFYLFIYLCNSD